MIMVDILFKVNDATSTLRWVPTWQIACSSRYPILSPSILDASYKHKSRTIKYIL